MYKIIVVFALLSLSGCATSVPPPRPIHRTVETVSLKDQLRLAVDHIWDGIVELDATCAKVAQHQTDFDNSMSTIGQCTFWEVNAELDRDTLLSFFLNWEDDDVYQLGNHLYHLMESYQGFLEVIRLTGYQPSMVVRQGAADIDWLRMLTQHKDSLNE